MLKPAVTALLLAGIAQPMLADEVWSTPIGEVIYERDLPNGEAVLSYPVDAAVRGLAFIQGLGGTYTSRGSFSGVWIEDDLPPGEGCGVSLADPETGAARNNWGRLDVVFTEPDFPGGFVAIRGDCFNDPSDYLIAKPVVGE